MYLTAVPKPLPAAPLDVHHGHVIMVLRQLPAALPQQEKKNPEDLQRRKVIITCLFVQWQGNLHGDVPSASLSSWPLLRGGDGACFGRFYVACACGRKPWRRPPAALPGAEV
jgi:hypothetical protein